MSKKMYAILAGAFFLALALVGNAYAQEEVGMPSELVCDGTMDHPVIEYLADKFEVESEELYNYFCDGFGIGEIRHALITAGMDVEETFDGILDDRLVGDMKVFGWGEIWQDYGLIGFGRPEMDDLEMEGDGYDADMVCEEDMVHPVLMTLAEQYGDEEVTYEVLLADFCEGFGVGEIKHALETAELDDVTESYGELLAMRSKEDEMNSTGWGEIWQELGLIGKERNGEMEGEGPELEEQNNKPDTPPGLIGNNGWQHEGHPGKGKAKGHD